MTITPIPASPGAPNSSMSPHKTRDAAEQFEALLVGQMLRQVRESASNDGDDDAGANSTFLEVAEEQLAQAIAARGGLGIATMVINSFGKSE